MTDLVHHLAIGGAVVLGCGALIGVAVAGLLIAFPNIRLGQPDPNATRPTITSTGDPS